MRAKQEEIRKGLYSTWGRIRRFCRKTGWRYCLLKSKSTASLYVELGFASKYQIKLRISNHAQSDRAEFIPTLKGKRDVHCMMATLIQADAHGNN